MAVWNRTPERAKALADDLGITCVLRPATCDLLVNATSVGLEPHLNEAETLAALHLDQLDPARIVVDLVYGDAPSALLGWAARGAYRELRIHDLRHTFICRRVQLWHDRGTDIDNAVAALSTLIAMSAAP